MKSTEDKYIQLQIQPQKTMALYSVSIAEGHLMKKRQRDISLTVQKRRNENRYEKDSSKNRLREDNSL